MRGCFIHSRHWTGHVTCIVPPGLTKIPRCEGDHRPPLHRHGVHDLRDYTGSGPWVNERWSQESAQACHFFLQHPLDLAKVAALVVLNEAESLGPEAWVNKNEKGRNKRREKWHVIEYLGLPVVYLLRTAKWAHRGKWRGVWLLMAVSAWLGYGDQVLGQTPG